MVILLNKAHYWVLKQHTDSTPQLTLSRSLTIERSFMLFSLLPRSRDNSINYTSVLCAVQIRFPWFAPQCFFPKLFHHHQQAIWESSKQETKTLYNWKSFNRFWLGETPKKFFVFSSSPRRLIQLYRCRNRSATRNRVKWTTNRSLKGSQTPSQTLNCLVSAFYGWQKIFKKLPKNLINTEETTQTLAESLLEPSQQPLFLLPSTRYLTDRCRKPLPFRPARNRRRGVQLQSAESWVRG